MRIIAQLEAKLGDIDRRLASMNHDINVTAAEVVKLDEELRGHDGRNGVVTRVSLHDERIRRLEAVNARWWAVALVMVGSVVSLVAGVFRGD